jgi:hypothetical protein
MGLELKPSKTKITHTLKPYQGAVGFDFLGWTVRQFPVGKTHTGTYKGRPLGFKTIIKPSKEAIKRHIAATKQVIRGSRAASQEQLIKDLTPIVRGWANYYPRIAQRGGSDEQVSRKMCLLKREKSEHSRIRRTDEQYRRFLGNNPDLFAICPCNAMLAGRIKPNEKPHFLMGCVVRSQ